MPIEDLADGRDIEAFARGVIRGYRRTLQGDRKHLLERFRYVHAARKVVGVGSVGTRAWIILMLGRDNEDPMFLQLKQAEASVLEPFVGESQYANHGQRVVEGQRLMQAASDIMLGWDRITGPDGVKWDFYMRQLWDNKGSVIIEGMKPRELGAYAEICGRTLARAHARSGDAVTIGAYLGSGDALDKALADFAELYADQNELDYAALSAAVKNGTRQSGDRALGGAMPIQESPNVVIHDPERANHLLMLEFGDRKDFDDPKLEYRRLFSELLGTFMLVLVAAGGGILHGKGQISLAAAVVAPGLMVLAIILFMGAVSGAHLNPVVSLAFAVRGDFPWKRVPGYIIVQLLGATLACLFLLAVFGNVEHLGATLPGPGYKDWQALLMEIALTGVLVSVILGTASGAQNVGALGALGVGGYIALAGLWSAPVSGTSMNPARSFGPALVSGDWTAYWVYVVGPLAGAAIAVGCAIILRGRGGDPISHAAGSGVLTPGEAAEKAKLARDIDAGKVVTPGLDPTSTGKDSEP